MSTFRVNGKDQRGQFEYFERAEAKLKIVVPATPLLIFV
jgi:Cu/Ag efflux pump CusA